ncbi:unnamed protein product (macronuclear) [Paramecium tetraurelia]|uniref:Uncharacterized protein n=1 Tax=Paramecium tetraurelia TaxID=5888 RepID=A0DWX0_PARTE|nr:uncharacterized protein GSPATT00021180001 [Paramecium tetraurelia]CAK87537.1 unnamed protein product [Paramecium tetraurelia]|eukprot:XP_001454934.1 hypothetical protein (macronuclear) [Paramecium tetraurelia strain d4-2]
MQYGKRLADDLSRSKIEIMEDYQRVAESVESLDSFLPQFHCENREQLEVERRVVAYLRSLGIQFKTDPAKKEQDYYEKPKKSAIIFQQTIGESPQIGPMTVLKFGGDQSTTQNDYGTWLNPFKARKQQSFEL